MRVDQGEDQPARWRDRGEKKKKGKRGKKKTSLLAKLGRAAESPMANYARSPENWRGIEFLEKRLVRRKGQSIQKTEPIAQTVEQGAAIKRKVEEKRREQKRQPPHKEPYPSRKAPHAFSLDTTGRRRRERTDRGTRLE